MKQTRKIKPSYRSVTGFFSYNNSSIPYESTLERDFLVYQAFKSNVTSIVAQPIQIKFNKNGRNYPYTPDFFISFSPNSTEQSMIVEVKPQEEWKKNWHKWKEKWKTMIRYCKDNNYKFRIYDESRIRHKALDNIYYLQRYKNLSCEIEDKSAIIEQVKIMGHTTVDYLLTRFFKGSLYRFQGLRIIYNLLATKQLRCDIFSTLNEQLIVWVE